MEPKKQNQASMIAAVVIAVLALLCAILVCLSSMPNGIKCRAALLIIAASGAVIAALMKPRAGSAELRELYEVRTKLQQTETELRKSRQTADALQQQLTQVSRSCRYSVITGKVRGYRGVSQQLPVSHFRYLCHFCRAEDGACSVLPQPVADRRTDRQRPVGIQPAAPGHPELQGDALSGRQHQSAQRTEGAEPKRHTFVEVMRVWKRSRP